MFTNIKVLVEGFELSAAEVTKMELDPAFKPNGTRPANWSGVACEWVRGHTHVWEAWMLTHERAAEVVWQAPLFYNYGLAEAAFFTRCTAILRSFFMMGFLIPCSEPPSFAEPVCYVRCTN